MGVKLADHPLPPRPEQLERVEAVLLALVDLEQRLDHRREHTLLARFGPRLVRVWVWVRVRVRARAKARVRVKARARVRVRVRVYG